MPEVTRGATRFGPPTRGVSAGDVERAADTLLRAGERPTIEKVREKLGSGSPNTINPLLDAWWKRLSARLDSGPAALHRLPESVAHAAEALWMQALDEGRRRAAQETHATTRALATDKQSLEVRSHVLSLRESELESRLRDREQRQAALEAQLQDLTTLLRKEQATREAQERRIADLEQRLLLRAPTPTPRPTQKKSQPRSPHRRKAQRETFSKRKATKTRKTSPRGKSKPGRR
jgi:chromosome segregation ATPase